MDRVVKKYEQFNEQDPYNEEVWDDNNYLGIIYKELNEKLADVLGELDMQIAFNEPSYIILKGDGKYDLFIRMDPDNKDILVHTTSFNRSDEKMYHASEIKECIYFIINWIKRDIIFWKKNPALMIRNNIN